MGHMLIQLFLIQFLSDFGENVINERFQIVFDQMFFASARCSVGTNSWQQLLSTSLWPATFFSLLLHFSSSSIILHLHSSARTWCGTNMTKMCITIWVTYLKKICLSSLQFKAVINDLHDFSHITKCNTQAIKCPPLVVRMTNKNPVTQPVTCLINMRN